MRNVWRCAPFLKALGTHCISRSGPRPPTRSAYSLASPLSPWLPAPCHTHTQSRPSGRLIQHHTRTFYFNHRANRGSLPALALRAPYMHVSRPTVSQSYHGRTGQVPACVACGSQGILCKRRVVRGAVVGAWSPTLSAWRSARRRAGAPCTYAVVDLLMGYDMFFSAKPRTALYISGAGTHSDDTI